PTGSAPMALSGAAPSVSSASVAAASLASGSAAVGASSATVAAAVPGGSSAAIAPPASSLRKWVAWAAGIAAFLVAAAAVFLFSTRHARALTDKDTVVLSDFVNTTGDPVFDGTLKQALAVQLDQSPYLNLLPESKVQEALKYMGRKPDERVTRDL